MSVRRAPIGDLLSILQLANGKRLFTYMYKKEITSELLGRMDDFKGVVVTEGGRRYAVGDITITNGDRAEDYKVPVRYLVAEDATLAPKTAEQARHDALAQTGEVSEDLREQIIAKVPDVTAGITRVEETKVVAFVPPPPPVYAPLSDVVETPAALQEAEEFAFYFKLAAAVLVALALVKRMSRK